MSKNDFECFAPEEGVPVKSFGAPWGVRARGGSPGGAFAGTFGPTLVDPGAGVATGTACGIIRKPDSKSIFRR